MKQQLSNRRVHARIVVKNYRGHSLPLIISDIKFQLSISSFIQFFVQFFLPAARSRRRQEETRQSLVGLGGRGSEAMCSRAFHDAAGGSGPFGRVSSVPSAGAATRYSGGTSRRDSAFRVAKHFAYKHGEERYVIGV